MKKLTMKSIAIILLSSFMIIGYSCKKKETTPEPIVTPEPEPNLVVIEGEIADERQLDASKKYLLRGKVYVVNGGKIVIPAGTVVMGEKSTDGTLIINRGGKIDARGTAANPIIFTSEAPAGFRNRGDWGGIVICGRSHTNGNANSTIEGISASAGSENGLYGPGSGAAILDDNSGVMTYCRIDFAGIDLSLDNELNSLTMGSVGSGTEIHHIMVTYANDDAYEWFGGSINHKYLIAYNTLDDDFDSDRGFNGKIQYGVIVREKATADISTSRAFEASSNSDAAASPHSAPKFANITVLGPRTFTKSGATYGTIDGLYGAAVEINSNSNLELYNSIVTGFPTGARFNGAGADSKVKNCIFTDNATLVSASGGSVIPANFSTTDGNIEVADRADIFGASATYSFAIPSPLLLDASSTYISGAPAMSSVDAYFENQPFYGAFGTTPHAGWDWGTAWINFDPINAVY
jgi:hypothetical protein